MYIYKKRSLIILFTIIDAVGSLLAWPFKAFGRKPAKGPYRRIAVLRLDHIGDVIMATAVLKPLRKSFPSAEIDMVVPSWAFDLVKASPDTTRVTLFDAVWFDRRRTPSFVSQFKGVLSLARLIRKAKYDVVIDLRGDFRHIFAMWLSGAKRRISYGVTGGGFLLTDEVKFTRGLHQTDLNMELIGAMGVSAAKTPVELYVMPEAKRKAEKVLRENGLNGPYAVVHVSPGHSSKVWDTDGFFAVSGYLSGARDMSSVFVGAPADSDIVKSIVSRLGKKACDLCGRTDLETLAAIIRNSSFFIGVDSAPAHIASAFKVPGVVLFSGVNDPKEWAPQGDSLRVIYPGEGKDLSSVTPREVCEAVEEMLGRKAHSAER